MSYARLNEFLFTTPVRLTLGFLSLYALGSVLIFGYLNYQLSATLTRQIDKLLLDQQSLLVLQAQHYGFSGVYRAIQSEIMSKGKDERAYRITDRKGQVVFQAGDLRLPNLPSFDGIRELHIAMPPTEERQVARVISFQLPQKMRAEIAINMLPATRLTTGFWNAFIKTEILIVLLGLTIGLWLARRFWAQIEAFNEVTQQIVTSGELSGRIPVHGNDEFALLATNVNAMLERIERLVQGVRQVGDNIAHDLRTPLTRLRADVEMALQQDDADICRATLERALVELNGMQATFGSLLAISQAEVGSKRLRKRPIDFTELLNEMIELYSPAAEENQLVLEEAIAPGLMLTGDRQILAQVFANLFDNAMKYVPGPGKLLLRAEMKDNLIQVVLEDSGPGIPTDMREKVFERFARLDPARTYAGTGLGLSLVKAFIELHQGSVKVTQSALGGAAFTIHLPLS